MNAQVPITEAVDVLIVGAGISGIGMAVHLAEKCPGKTFAIVDRRANLGGTWDLFRYPGIRSDSDMHTLGFAFEPWKHEKAIADGGSILDYLNRIVDERGLRSHLRFDRKVISSDFSSETGRWSVLLESADGTRSRIEAGFLYLGSGYYDYDAPYEADFKGREDFKGQIIHPQFWPQDLDFKGKKIVVIGSGATAVTIVPSMAAQGAGHVTMLQRTPTWYIARPAKDGMANFLRKILPEKLAYRITRYKNIHLQALLFKRSRTQPDKIREMLTKQAQDELGDKYDAATFTPPYNPWEQRLCLIPDSDLYKSIREGSSDIVTDTIDRFDATGIKLNSGKHLDADIIVTATGLKLAVVGKIAVSVDGQPVDFSQRYYYRNAMFSNVPNFVSVFGYLNASWTLRVDIIGEYICRLLNHMDKIGANVAIPQLSDDAVLDDDNIFDFSSGYIQRSLHELPKSAKTQPWRLNQEYVADRKDMRQAPIDDGVMVFSTAGQRAKAPALEAAE